MSADDQADRTAYDEQYDLIYSACCKGLLEEVKLLLERVLAHSEDKQEDLRQLLFAASSTGHSSIVSYLLSEGAIINSNDAVRAARHAKTPQGIEVFQILLDHGWDINTDDLNFGTALVQALRNNNIPLVQFLIANGSDVNQEALAGSVDFRIRKKLLGVPLGTTPLDVAARTCPVDTLQLLIDHGAKLGRTNALHQTACYWGSDINRIPVMQFLIDKGMDVNALETYEEGSIYAGKRRAMGTPLHYAARWKNLKAIKFLLENGADSQLDGAGIGKPLDWALLWNPEVSPEIVELLMGPP